MSEINWKSFPSGLSFILKLIACSEKVRKLTGYRVISTEYYRYVAFEDKPSLENIRFVVNSEQAFIFRDQIEALPYLLFLDCRFVFEEVIYKAF